MSEQKIGSTDISNFDGNYKIGNFTGNYTIRTSPPYSTIKDDQPGTIILHRSNNSPLVTISADGKITYGPDYEPDRAADIFWRAVGNRKPNDAKRIAELEAALKPFADVPSHGEFGGPMVQARVYYEREPNDRCGVVHIDSSAFRAARAVLGEKDV